MRLKNLIGRLYQFKFYGKILDKKEAKQVIKSTTLEECNTLLREVFEKPTISAFIYGNAKKEDLMTKAELNKLFK